MSEISVVSIHSHRGFVPDDFSDTLEQLDENYNFYCLKHNSDYGFGSSFDPVPNGFYEEDKVFEDINGRGMLPNKMIEEVAEYDKTVFTGSYATRCVRRAIDSSQDFVNAYLGQNLTYENTAEGRLTVEEIRDDPSMNDSELLKPLYLDTEIEDYLEL